MKQPGGMAKARPSKRLLERPKWRASSESCVAPFKKQKHVHFGGFRSRHRPRVYPSVLQTKVYKNSVLRANSCTALSVWLMHDTRPVVLLKAKEKPCRRRGRKQYAGRQQPRISLLTPVSRGQRHVILEDTLALSHNSLRLTRQLHLCFFYTLARLFPLTSPTIGASLAFSQTIISQSPPDAAAANTSLIISWRSSASVRVMMSLI